MTMIQNDDWIQNGGKLFSFNTLEKLNGIEPQNHRSHIELYNIERQHTRGKPCPFEPANMAVYGGGSSREHTFYLYSRND